MPQRTHPLRNRTRDVKAWWARLWTEKAEVTATTADEPLRAELFSADQMAVHGQRLGAAHVVDPARLPDQLLARLASNERVLVELGKRLATTADAERRLTPAAEWLLDNFYLIEEEVRTARRHLPRGYSRELPRLTLDPANGGGAGQPRVYALALQAVAHGDGQIGRGSLKRFIAAYQSVQTLLLGELWACPIMLRLALIENLRRVASRVAIAHAERQTAGIWAQRMLDVAEKAPSELILVVADMARSTPPLTNAFVAEFARRLQGRGAGLALPLTWMEQRLTESHHTIEQLVHLEGQQQAANQVSVSNSIGSLRLLGAINWREFVESLSGVELALRDDPSGTYAQMDFTTRDSLLDPRERHGSGWFGKNAFFMRHPRLPGPHRVIRHHITLSTRTAARLDDLIPIQHATHLQAADGCLGFDSNGESLSAAQGGSDGVIAHGLHAMNPTGRSETFHAARNREGQAATAGRAENAERFSGEHFGDLITDGLHAGHAARRHRECADLVARVQFFRQTAQTMHHLGTHRGGRQKILDAEQVRPIGAHLPQLPFRSPFHNGQITRHASARTTSCQPPLRYCHPRCRDIRVCLPT